MMSAQPPKLIFLRDILICFVTVFYEIFTPNKNNVKKNLVDLKQTFSVAETEY